MSDVQNVFDAVFSGIEGGGYSLIVEIPLEATDTHVDRMANSRPIWQAIRPGSMPELAEMSAANAWYFSPVVYSQPERNADKIIEGATLWVDLDTAQVDPFTVTPRPSIIIQTSKQHYHLYWLLQSALSLPNLQHYSHRLAYSLGLESVQWKIDQLLRLPVGLNDKYGTQIPVKLISFEPHLRYDIDAFARLPPLPIGVADGKLAEAGPVPSYEEGEPERIYERFSDVMSARLSDLLRRQQRDRSRALWFIYDECYKIGITDKQCFTLVRGTANDIFSHLRYSASESLWRDVVGGYLRARNGTSDRGVIDRMTAIRASKKDLSVRLDELGHLLIKDMKRTGHFYQTQSGDLYYLDLAKRVGNLIKVDVKSAGLRKLVLDRYAINPGTLEWAQLYEHIAARCQDDDPVVVHRFAHYDRLHKVLYINKYDNQIYRVTARGYEIVPNGADGVLFLNPVAATPYSIARSPTKPNVDSVVSLWEELVLSCAHLSDEAEGDSASQKEIRHIMYSWVLALFFKDLFPVKPILLIHGETGSGKTMFFKTVLKVLLGPDASPDAPYNGEEAFDNAATNSEAIYVDNVDVHNSWLGNKLALVATGYRVVKRRLYTNNESFTVMASCFVGITSRHPTFLKDRDDVAERLIVCKVVPWAKFLINEGELLKKLSDNRSLLWGEIIEDLVAILGVLEQAENTGGLPRFRGNFRQADFAAFLDVTSGLKGMDADVLRRHIKRLQGQEALYDNPFVFVMKQWLSRPKNEGRVVTITALHTELQTMPGGEEFLRKIKSPRGIAIALGRSPEHWETAGIKIHKHGAASPSYSFTTV